MSDIAVFCEPDDQELSDEYEKYLAFTSSVAPTFVSSGRNRILNDSLPGARIAYSVYASCENSRVTGGVGLSEPSAFVPPGNGLF